MITSNILAAKASNGKWLPLLQHLEDTKNVMEQLLEVYVAPSVYEASGLEYDSFRRLALFVAFTHDIGKATSSFQIKMCDVLSGYQSILQEENFTVKITGLEEKSPHALAGAAILSQEFDLDESICEIIASHHGRPLDSGKESNFRYQMTICRDNYYSSNSYNSYKNAWNEIISKAVSYADVNDLKDISIKAKMLITGLLVMADWIASCELFFPLLEPYSTSVDLNRTQKGMSTLNLEPYHDFNLASMDSGLFKNRFGFLPNEMQKKVMEITNGVNCPGIMIIEAPMGLGKTEAALAAAEIESGAAGTGGIFFGLPTRGTADAMFDRVKDWAMLLPRRKSSSMGLAHGSAGFNDSYNALKTSIYDEEKNGLSVNSWMTGRYRKLLPDFAIGTVDQALFTVLKRKFLMLLHLGIAGKTVIIDEVHSYDDYMTEFMKSMLSWLGAYHVPTILLSATLTKEKRNELISAYLNYEISENTDAYPAITWADGMDVFSVAIEKDAIKKTRVLMKQTDKADTGKILSDLLSDGGCGGVICDTVSHAQAVYDDLKHEMPIDYTIILLHSRFLPDDRSRLERKILELVGKNSREERNKVIVVGTQVLEQSLDLDFDVMFTEKCPIDLLFQRLGRLHRHQRNNRPEKVKKAVCYIYKDEESCKGAEIYQRYVIRRTDEVIPENGVLSIPDDIRRFTEEVYDLDRGSDGDDKQEYQKHREELKRLSKAYLLPTADKCGFKGMLTIENIGIGNASVRVGIDSIDMILLKQKGQNYETFSGMEIQSSIIPNEEQTKELVKNKISLRYDDELLAAEVGDQNYKDLKVWRKNCYLEGEHFLVADENGRFIIGKHLYRYSGTYGWRKEA